jgi:hypothetical protein
VELDSVIDRDAAASRRWYYGWSSFFLVVGAGQLVLAEHVNNPAERPDWRVGAFMAGLGWAATVALPPPTLFAEGSDPARRGDASYRARACERERRLIASAGGDERFGTSWLAHTAGIAANVAAGLYLWLHHDRLGAGILQTVGGIAISELQVFTHPTRARDFDIKLAATPFPGGGGLALNVTF